MRQSILLTAILGTLSFAQVSYAAEVAKEEASDWDATANISFVSDYYFRGLSQTWHKPTAQGGLDITHSSGFYAGVWGSAVTPNTYPDANTEIDVYAGYNGSIPVVEKLGYTVGIYSYMYPGGSWKKYDGLTADRGKKSGGKWDTTELNFGLSYDWISAKVSYSLTDWFGAEKATGWDGSTKGSTYFELNAAYPLPWWDLTVIGHVGHMNVAGKLQASGFPTANGAPGTYETDPDYTDWKLGLSKNFAIGKSEGWAAGLYWVEASNDRYWGGGYGGTSFSRSINGTTETKDLNDGRFVFTLGRTF